jgi:hypothetical protein
MPEWLEQNWYWVFGMIALVAWIAIRVRLRGGDESMWRRILYAAEPDMDPRGKPQAKLSRLGVVMVVAIVVVIAVMNFVLDLND